MFPVITTAADRPVSIGHFGYPDPAPAPAPAGTSLCSYIHLDLTTEELNCSARYNCWGFTFIPRRFTINTGTDVDKVLEDNCTSIADGTLQPGDVIRYRNYGSTTHTGRIWEVDAAGHAVTIRSKWGGMGEYLHPPLIVPASYGTDLAYFRQHSPLKGVADLWIPDSPTDDGEQCSHQPWWCSPDILVDIPPFDGTGDGNPVFGDVNRIWARVQNRANTVVNSFYVKYYWADPAAGLGPSDWHAMLSTPGHPNPVGPLTIPAFGTIDAPYVNWTPTAAPAHQCLLAIAYVNDNPADSDNPDPLVYSFDIPWDNNISQRNVDVIHMKMGGKKSVGIGIKNPFPLNPKYSADIKILLTHSPRLSILGSVKHVKPLLVKCRIGTGKTFELSKPDGLISPLLRGKIKFPFMGLHETLLATGMVQNIRLIKPQSITLDISVPKDAIPGTTYYIHVVQQNANQIRGGYTVAVIVDKG